MMNVQSVHPLVIPAPLQKEPLLVTIAFCLPQGAQHHEQYIHSFTQACNALNIQCKAVSIHSTSLDSIVQTLEHVPLTLIICLDNNFAHAIMIARAKLHLSAPLIIIDLEVPKAIPPPLPPKCITIATPIETLVTQLCAPLVLMPSLKHIGLIYDENDAVLFSLLPDIQNWLMTHNYTVYCSPRKPTISSSDVATIAHYDLLMFLCRNAPSHYIQRLAFVCKAHQTLLYTASNSAIAHGAICTFGPNLTLVVQETIDILVRYITTNNSGGDRSVDYQLIINEYELSQYAAYKAELAPFIRLAQETSIITPTTADKVSAYLRLEHIPLE